MNNYIYKHALIKIIIMLIKNLSDSIFTLWVDAQSSGSFSTIFTLPTSPYKIIYSDAKRHGCYFKNYYYYNI
jgi:hypothetical protein